ncbi:hypothetical protein L3Q82_001260 [Scortum barcoo]|uniref:Uncharacterized protein n=1 Tax=Scortum barcoo TaxID=214431 RepID=A0ACB8WA05_9TELE|nr:hypothetical protein L3Q82_001260 [Scortum barcoo]
MRVRCSVHHVVVKKELSRKAKLDLLDLPVNLRSHSSPMVMNFGDRVRSSVTREELGVELLLLRIERSQLRWLGHLFRMPPGRLPREVFQACPTGRRPRGRPRTRWRDYVSRLAWERLGIPPEELEEVSGEKIAAVTEGMGNKNAIPPKGPDTGDTQNEDGTCIDGVTGSLSRDGPPGPSPELLASLQSLRENSDYTLLPHSLHQIAEAYSLKGD